MNDNKLTPLDTNTLSKLQKEAQAAGKACVVAALITNQNNEIFVQKRSLTSWLFPGCWDIAGWD